MSAITICGIVISTISESMPDSPRKVEPGANVRFELPQANNPNHSTSVTIERTMFAVLRIFGILIVLLWVRVLLEQSIRLFNITMSLASIDKKMKG